MQMGFDHSGEMLLPAIIVAEIKKGQIIEVKFWC
jgi:hypothetical protein